MERLLRRVDAVGIDEQTRFANGPAGDPDPVRIAVGLAADLILTQRQPVDSSQPDTV